VELPLHLRRHEVVDLGDVSSAESAEVVSAALRARLLVLADLVLDRPGGELATLLDVLPACPQRSDARRLCLGWVANGLRHRRHLLGALAEDVALQLLERALDGGELLGQRRNGGTGLVELGLEAFSPLSPLAAMIASAHWRR
jgi:hypothetical protein